MKKLGVPSSEPYQRLSKNEKQSSAWCRNLTTPVTLSRVLTDEGDGTLEGGGGSNGSHHVLEGDGDPICSQEDAPSVLVIRSTLPFQHLRPRAFSFLPSSTSRAIQRPHIGAVQTPCGALRSPRMSFGVCHSARMGAVVHCVVVAAIHRNQVM